MYHLDCTHEVCTLSGPFKIKSKGAGLQSAGLFPHRRTQPLLCPCRCRELGGMLGKKGWNVIAPDWLGHGNSDKVRTCT